MRAFHFFVPLLMAADIRPKIVTLFPTRVSLHTNPDCRGLLRGHTKFFRFSGFIATGTWIAEISSGSKFLDPDLRKAPRVTTLDPFPRSPYAVWR